MRRTFLLFVLIALILGSQCFAQEATGKIIGTVTDPAGAVIPGAEVIVTNIATQVINTAITDKDGVYQILHLPIGQYKVTARHTGFKAVVTKAYSLEINQSLRIDLGLAVGGAAETIEVTGNATTVEAYNSTIGASITEAPIVNLPLNGRNVLDLAKLQTGVVEQNPGNGAAGSFSIAGSRTDSVTFLLDGGSNNNLLDNGVVFNPNPDTVAEFRILQSNYLAEYGRNSGGIISVVTKSGTNQFHGSAFDYIRNDAFNANSFFNNLYGLPRDVLKRNQFGGTIGGPIKKEKLFFFVGYQGQRQTEQQTVGPLSTFTSKEITGDFSQSAGKSAVASFLADNPYFQADPVKRAQGIIDPTKIDPVAQNYIKAGLIPSTANGVLISKASAKTDFDELTTKLDFNFSANDRLSATLGWVRAPGTRPFAGGATTPFPVNDNSHTYFLNVAYTKAITPNLLNEARVTAQRLNQMQGTPSVKLPTSNQLGIQNSPDLATGPAIIYLWDSGILSGFSYRGPLTKVNNTFNYSDTLSWLKGHHMMKFGALFSPYQNNTIYAYEVNGEFDFYGSSTYVGTGAEFADFLLGLPDEYIQYGNAPSNIRSKSYGFFAQDEWRITHNLTLNFGLRYEYNSPKLDTQGRSFSLVPGAQSARFINAPQGLLFPGDQGAPAGANLPDKNDFAPRFGFAWSPFSNNKMSIRGGIGMFYDVLKGEDNLQFNGQAPFFGYSDLTDYYYPTGVTGPVGFLSDPYGSIGAANPFPSKPPANNIDFDANGFLPFGGSSVYFVDPHLRTPYVFHYNLAVERELPGGMLASAAYVGSTAHKLTSIVDANPFILGTTDRILNLQPNALSYSYSYTDEFRNVVNQSYSSFQASLRKQASSANNWTGATYFTLGYTWAKNIDNASGFREGSSRVSYYQPNKDRAVSDMDVAHRITFSGQWDVPFDKAWSSGPKRLTKGWGVFPILTWRTGFPIDLRGYLARNRKTPGPSGAGDSNLVRPNLAGDGIVTVNPYRDINDNGALWVPISNFITTPQSYGFCDPSWTADQCDARFNAKGWVPYQASYGTDPRNSFRGPGRTNMDFAVGKSTQLWSEKTALDIRVEMFNVFNHTQFDNPDSTHLNPADSATFGRITSTAEPRIIQLSARITF